jgi:probable rRNA maturation factor
MTAGLEVEVLGIGRAKGRIGAGEVRDLCARALAGVGIQSGHVAVEFVDDARIQALNRQHRDRDAVTDVLSFPMDGTDAGDGPSELGDVFVCPAQTADLAEAVVHGVLHLAGLDHETDRGEMLALQRELLAATRG